METHLEKGRYGHRFATLYPWLELIPSYRFSGVGIEAVSCGSHEAYLLRLAGRVDDKAEHYIEAKNSLLAFLQMSCFIGKLGRRLGNWDRAWDAVAILRPIFRRLFRAVNER